MQLLRYVNTFHVVFTSCFYCLIEPRELQTRTACCPHRLCTVLQVCFSRAGRPRGYLAGTPFRHTLELNVQCWKRIVMPPLSATDLAGISTEQNVTTHPLEPDGMLDQEPPRPKNAYRTADRMFRPRRHCKLGTPPGTLWPR